jgi:hypothetical protein
MKVALLVLGSSCPEVFREMVALFASHSDFNIYLHLDSRVDGDVYLRSCAEFLERVVLVSPSLPIYWGGFRMVVATELLANRALQDDANQIFCLLSDDSLPLYPPSILRDRLSDQPARIDLSLTSRNPTHLQRYTDYYCFDSDATTPRSLPAESRLICPEFSSAVMRLESLRRTGKYPFPAIWSGSQWWCFDRSTLESILDPLSSNTWIRESFEFSAVPDELVFHTLYANSNRFAIRSLTGPMHTDFTRDPAPYVYTSIEQSFPIREDKLFIRKISDGSASLIMNQLHHWWNARSL